MDNLHTLIVISLLAFGVGHALFSMHIRFWGFLLLMIILSPILFDVYESENYPTIISAFVAGLAFAHRERILELFSDIADAGRSLAEFFQRQKSKSKHKRKNQSNFDNDTHQRTEQARQQEWQAEQQRREQEVKNQRAREQQKNEQQKEKPTSQSGSRHNQANHNKKQSHKTNNNQSRGNTQQHHTKPNRPPKKTPPPTDNRSPLEILGLQAGFTQQELKKAYRRESARCHPDKWAGKPEHIQKAMEEEQKLVNQAYQQLKS